MALYRCGMGGGVRNTPKVIRKWTATAFGDSPKTYSGYISFTTNKKGMYILSTGGSNIGSVGADGITCNSFTPIGSSMTPIALNHDYGTVAHATAFYKMCEAGETHTFFWYVSTWNDVGDLEVTLLFIPT